MSGSHRRQRYLEIQREIKSASVKYQVMEESNDENEDCEVDEFIDVINQKFLTDGETSKSCWWE